MTHDHAAVCLCHAGHRPASLELHSHHVLPLFLGGPDTEANRVWVCPSQHGNVHELLRAMLKEGREISYGEFAARYDVPVNRYGYRLALSGYRQHAARMQEPRGVRLP